MSSVWEEFRNGGWMNWIILFFGLAGFAVVMVSVVLAASKSRAALPIGVAAAALGAWIAGLGLIGTFMGRRMVDEAVSGGSISPSQVERIRRVGYEEARSCAKFGVGFAMFPILAGAIAIAAGLSRRRSDAEPEANPWVTPGAPGAPESLQPIQSFYSPSGVPAPAANEAKPSAVLPAVVLGVAAVPIIASFAIIKAPLPGRDVDTNDPSWAVEEAADQVRAGELERGCENLEEALDLTDLTSIGMSSPKTAEVPGDIGAKCVDYLFKQALAAPDDERREKLGELTRSQLPKTEEQTRRINEAIASLEQPEPDALPTGDPAPAASASASARRTKPPKVAMGATNVSGRLPPEIIQRIVRQNFARFRLCYENGLARNPDLKGRVTVKFVIGRDGSVSVASGFDSDMPDSAVVSCVTRAFRSLSFPQPEGGIVTVVYPLNFSPG